MDATLDRRASASRKRRGDVYLTLTAFVMLLWIPIHNARWVGSSEFSFHRYTSLRDHLLMALWTLLESLGYRQLTVLWRVRGIWGYLRKRRAWGAMERRGFAEGAGASSGR